MIILVNIDSIGSLLVNCDDLVTGNDDDEEMMFLFVGIRQNVTRVRCMLYRLLGIPHALLRFLFPSEIYTSTHAFL